MFAKTNSAVAGTLLSLCSSAFAPRAKAEEPIVDKPLASTTHTLTLTKEDLPTAETAMAYQSTLATASLPAQNAQAFKAEKELPLFSLANTFEFAAARHPVEEETAFRFRALNTLDIHAFGMHGVIDGLNEIEDLNLHTYYGRNVVGLGPEDWPLKAAMLLEIRGSEVADPKGGIRWTKLPFDLYGWVDVTANEHAINVTPWIGREWPELVKGLSTEALYTHEQDSKLGGTDYLEPQVNFKVAGISNNPNNPNDPFGTYIFVRAEISDFKWEEANLLAGVQFRF